MPNKQYLKGRRLEYEIIHLLKQHLPKDKYTILRTAGSKSPVDIVIIKHLNNKVTSIQCKSTKKNTLTIKFNSD